MLGKKLVLVMLLPLSVLIILGTILYFKLRYQNVTLQTTASVNQQKPLTQTSAPSYGELTFTNDVITIDYPSTLKKDEETTSSYNYEGKIVTFYVERKLSNPPGLCGTTYLAINIDNSGRCGFSMYYGVDNKTMKSKFKVLDVIVDRYDVYSKDGLSFIGVVIPEFRYRGQNLSVVYIIQPEDQGRLIEIKNTFEHMLSTLR